MTMLLGVSRQHGKSMNEETYPDSELPSRRVRLVILDLDAFLYPYDKAFRNAALRAWREIRKEYGLPIFRRRTAQKLIEVARKEARQNPDDTLCQHICKLAERLQSKGPHVASVIGMLETYYRSGRAVRLNEDIHDRSLEPPYKDMIAVAFNLRLLQDRKRKKKSSLARGDLQTKIIEGEKGITRLWNRHMGTAFLRADAGLANRIERLRNSGVEVAVLTHSFKEGEGEAMEKLAKLGLDGVIPEKFIFGLEEISPHQKGTHPEVFENVLAAINKLRGGADPILPPETIMAEDTIGNLRGAKKAGMKTAWVPRTDKDAPHRPSQKLQKKLASVDHIYATPHEFLDALNAAISAGKDTP